MVARDRRTLTGAVPATDETAYPSRPVPAPRPGEYLTADGAAGERPDVRVASLALRGHGLLAGASARPARSLQAVPGWAVVSAALAPVLLTVGWLVAGVFQPSSYSPMRQTVSILAGHTGTDNWIMTWALLLTGGCYLLTAAGLAGLWLPARILLIVAGLCSIGIATSPEPVTGPTAVHLAWTTLGAATLAIWPAVVGWRVPQRVAILGGRNSLVVTAAFLAMLGWVMFEIWAGHALGLAERVTGSTMAAWPFVVALVWRRTAGAGRARGATRASLSGQPSDSAVRAERLSAEYDSPRR